MKVKAILMAALMALPVRGAAFMDLDSQPKSMFFAGRCMAPVLLREEISTKDLKQVPDAAAFPHLFGERGTVWHGDDPSLLLVKLDAGAFCGINVFDEELEDVEAFMSYWLDREDSPFEFTERKETDETVTLIYDGFCDDCGFNVHARALYLKADKFTVYRVYATTPEKAG
ncbi:hypothetical protein [Pseudaestuariivita sp.]|uniref:hypothetical protein n=1 Tax=Pseudaestuariivita sp. TaxID=2211669 RepID=UPI00405A2610